MSNGNHQLAELDNKKLQLFHFRLVFTAGMGFFTDAYDLFIIGIVTAILTPIWHLTLSQLALLNSAALVAAALGSVFCGIMSDKFGRKRLYGIEIMILFVGALVSALAPSFIWLLIARCAVGFGIGGDYPTSALIVSESSGVKYRGFLVLMVFAMQALGLLVGPLVASILLYLSMSPDTVWRLLLALGAIPAASVFYLRRKISESPRYLMTQAAPIQVSRIVADLAGQLPKVTGGFKQHTLWNKRWLICLLGTAGAWFLLDIAFYGNSISSMQILKILNPNADLLRKTIISTLIFLCFAVPGYIAAALFVDKIGRKLLQYIGFAMMSLMFFCLAWIPAVYIYPAWFVLIFGISYFFTNFGPNSTTFLIPAEIYPTSIRGKAHGFSAAIGKAGAFLGVYCLPFILKQFGLATTMGIMGVVCLLGILVTLLIPEMTGKSLDIMEDLA